MNHSWIPGGTTGRSDDVAESEDPAPDAGDPVVVGAAVAAGRDCGAAVAVAKRVVVGARNPEAVEQDREFSRDGDGCFLLGQLGTASCECLAKPSEVAVRGERAEDVASCLDEQSSQLRITSLADPELRVAVA